MVKRILSLFVSQSTLNQSQSVRYVNRYRSIQALLVSALKIILPSKEQKHAS